MKKKDRQLIQAINKEAWDLYGKDLLKKEKIAPDVARVIDLSLNEEKEMFTEEQLKDIQTLKDTGVAQMEEWTTDDEVEKKFNEYTQRRLVEEIEKGNLSNPKTDPYFKKLQQDEKRTIRRQKTKRRLNN